MTATPLTVQKFKTQKLRYEESIHFKKVVVNGALVLKWVNFGGMTDDLQCPVERDKTLVTVPTALTPYLEKVARSKFNEMLDEALKLWDADIKNLAAIAIKDHEDLLRDAGLTPKSPYK